eukprot:1441807-Amphidinium_carterae.1
MILLFIHLIYRVRDLPFASLYLHVYVFPGCSGRERARNSLIQVVPVAAFPFLENTTGRQPSSKRLPGLLRFDLRKNSAVATCLHTPRLYVTIPSSHHKTQNEQINSELDKKMTKPSLKMGIPKL